MLKSTLTSSLDPYRMHSRILSAVAVTLVLQSPRLACSASAYRALLVEMSAMVR